MVTPPRAARLPLFARLVVAAATLPPGVAAQADRVALPPPLVAAPFGLIEGIPKAEYAERRTRVMAAIGDGVAILQGSAEWPSYQKFRQTAQVAYLGGVAVPRLILVLDGRARRTTLYLAPRNERLERSEGPVLHAGYPQAADFAGVDEVRDRAEFAVALQRFREEGRVLWLPHRSESRFAGTPESSRGWDANTLADPWDGRLSREQQFIARVRAAAPGLELRNLDPVVDALRMRKSRAEIALIREATRQSGLALLEAMRSVEPGLGETEIEALGDFVFKRHGSQAPAYYGLVAAGPNAFWPHYHAALDTLRDGQLLLFDYAPDYRYYTSDVTRMMPVNGRWSADQRELYATYLGLYNALMGVIRPGVPIRTLLDEAADRMDAYLANARIRNPEVREAAKRFVEQHRNPARRSLGHHVGLEVHDVTVPYDVLEPGMVFTIEPALTIPDERVYVRLEDVILVTETGHENLSGWVPMEPEAIERVMREPGLLQLDRQRPPFPGSPRGAGR